MSDAIFHPFQNHGPRRRTSAGSVLKRWSLFLLVGLTSGCSYLMPPPPVPDPAAEALLTRLKQTNAGLTQFKWVGRLSLSRPNRPAQAYRAAIAGQLQDRLRMDLFSPFGGSAATLSSDGHHLYVIEHASRSYHKKAVGQGNLRQLVGLDLQIGDLLELMVGRIPFASGCIARLRPDETGGQHQLELIDRRGRVCQRITLDGEMWPEQTVWFDTAGKPVYMLTLSRVQIVDGFRVPSQLTMSATTGQQLSLRLDRFMANTPLPDDLFSLPPPPS